MNRNATEQHGVKEFQVKHGKSTKLKASPHHAAWSLESFGHPPTAAFQKFPALAQRSPWSIEVCTSRTPSPQTTRSTTSGQHAKPERRQKKAPVDHLNAGFTFHESNRIMSRFHDHTMQQWLCQPWFYWLVLVEVVPAAIFNSRKKSRILQKQEHSACWKQVPCFDLPCFQVLQLLCGNQGVLTQRHYVGWEPLIFAIAICQRKVCCGSFVPLNPTTPAGRYNPSRLSQLSGWHFLSKARFRTKPKERVQGAKTKMSRKPCLLIWWRSFIWHLQQDRSSENDEGMNSHAMLTAGLWQLLCGCWCWHILRVRTKEKYLEQAIQ